MKIDLEYGNIKLACDLDNEYSKDAWGNPLDEFHFQIKENQQWYSLRIISIHKDDLSGLIEILQRLNKLLILK